MTDETSDNGFAVGYKKPPRHSRFQPGRSGYPGGRQKGVRNLGSDVKRTLEVPVRLYDEQGRARRVSTQEAALLRLREKALKGDARSIVQLLELAKIFNNNAAVESVGDKALAAEDQAILDAYAEEVRSRPPNGAISVRQGAADEDSGANLDG
jgi:Family of unknown function (DUF5681)